MTKSMTRLAGGALALGGALSLVFAGTAAAAPVNPENVALTVTADRSSPEASQTGTLYATLVLETDYDDANYCRAMILPADADPTLEELANLRVPESLAHWWVGSYGHAWGHESYRIDVSDWDDGDYKYMTSCYTNGAQADAVAGPVVHVTLDSDADERISVTGSDAGNGDGNGNGNGNGNGDDDDDDNGDGDDSTGSLSGGSLGSSGGNGSLGSLTGSLSS